MEPYRPSFRRRMASLREFLRTLLAMFKPQTQEVRLQRVCPFCGLITPRAKRVCLECGKSLSSVSLERKEAKQEG
jgi:predicted amidophosphoribosyltransferase